MESKQITWTLIDEIDQLRWNGLWRMNVTSSNQNGFLGRLWLGLKSQVEKVVVNILGVLRRVNPREHGVGQSLWICLPTGIISLPNCFFRFQV
jgi:hypothetical protein